MGKHWSHSWVVYDKDWVFAWNVWKRKQRVIDLRLEDFQGFGRNHENVLGIIECMTIYWLICCIRLMISYCLLKHPGPRFPSGNR